jgi:hypothetical protein
MEGKEINNEDDELKPGSGKDNQEESDDFGLPETSFDSDTDEGEVNDQEDDSQESYEEPIEEPAYESEPETAESQSGGFGYTSGDNEQRRSNAGLIVFLSIVGVLVIAFAIYWFVIRTPKKQPQPVVEKPVEQVIDTAKVEPVVEPPVVEEPVVEEPSTSGTFETITEKTGRYYIVLNSFFDEDLAADYAKNLSEKGTSTLILSPPERKGFRRVVINEDFGNWREAEARLGDLKMTFGDAIWVLRF